MRTGATGVDSQGSKHVLAVKEGASEMPKQLRICWSNWSITPIQEYAAALGESVAGGREWRSAGQLPHS